jgi:phage-related protein
MPTYPLPPFPSHVSPPAILDPMIEFSSDQGYQIRRARTSRPRRRWTLDYLGKTVDEMRQIRDFLQQSRLGALEFAWAHPTAIDKVTVAATTPVTVQWRHGLYTGMWIFIFNSPNPSINNQAFQITRFNEITITLNGTSAAGINGTADALVYVPHAVGIFREDTFESPATLIGPEQVLYTDRRTGYYSFSVTIEEIF